MAQFPSQSSASDIWSLTDVSRAVQGQNWPVMSAYESIATTTVGAGGTSAITFSSIPSGYKNLQIRSLIRTNRTTSPDACYMYLNSDTTKTNYTLHVLYGDGASVSSGGYASSSAVGMQSVLVAGDSLVGGNFSISIIDILDYANTNKYKTVRSIGSYGVSGSGYAELASGCWLNTAAVTNFQIVPINGTLFNQYSHFALYGIKG